MPAFIIAIAGCFGISPLRVIVYGALIMSVVIGAATIRHHYIQLGWNKAITAVKKQDDRAKAAADAVDKQASECAANSYWDVIAQSCRAGY